MVCKKPFFRGLLAHACGQCLPCRINRRRLWTHRMMLESQCHKESAFVTLTYAPEKLPVGSTLVPQHPQRWLKKLRKAVAPHTLRFFLVGEYGDQSERPHYHAALFGYPPCYNACPLTWKCLGCYPCETLRKSWDHGHIFNGSLTEESSAYIAGYVTKKMTAKDDIRLNGRYPEFARMSRRPGIGALAMKDVANVLTTDAGCNLIIQNKDVPMALNHGKKSKPLGRYLRSKLRETLGFKETGSQPEVLQTYYEEMRALLSINNSDASKPYKSFKEIVNDANLQKIRNIEARDRIFKKGSKL